MIGEINRNKSTHILPGGKGINVSILLKVLGINSIAMGFIAGFVGDEIERKVKEYGIKTDFIRIEEGISRINVKLVTQTEETAFNDSGPLIKHFYIDELFKKLEKVEDGDFLVLAGSIPKGITDNVYKEICKKMVQKNVKIIVDATGDLLLNTLEYKPFLIKPNQDELGEMFKVKIKDKEDAILYAKKLQQKGAKNVLISMGKQGSVLLDENKVCYKKKAPNSKRAMSTVGAGDSMIAGFIAGLEFFGSYEKALDLGTQVATATVQSISLATKEEIDKILGKERKSL